MRRSASAPGAFSRRARPRVLVVLAHGLLDVLELVLAVVAGLAPLDDVLLSRPLAGDGLARAPQRLLRVGLAAAML